MRLLLRRLAVPSTILLLPTLLLTILSVQALSYRHLSEKDLSSAQAEVAQRIGRIADIGDRFGITANVLAFTVQFQASTTAIVGLPVESLGPGFFAPVKITYVEIRNCVASIESNFYASFSDCFGKNKTYNAGSVRASILERLGHENIIISFRPDFLSTVVIFGIIFIFLSAFLITLLKVTKMVHEMRTD